MTGRVVVFLCATLVALGLAEAATRVLVPDPYLAFENRIEMFVEDEHTGYRNRPNFGGYAQGRIRVRTNSLGFRGGETAIRDERQTLRLLFLGDSVTWGVGVREEAIYPQVLERQLQGAGDVRSEIDIANAGTVGYSLHQELLQLEHRGLSLAPDVVVVGFALNDAYPTEDPFFNIHRFHQPLREGVGRRDYPPMPKPASYLYRWVRSEARRLKERREPRPSGPRAVPWPPGSFEARAWPVLQKHFLKMVELADRHDFKMMVLIFPTSAQFEAGSSSLGPQTLLRGFFDAAGVAYIDLFDTLGSRWAHAFMDNMHLTPEGHRLVANRLFAELRTRKWLDK